MVKISVSIPLETSESLLLLAEQWDTSMSLVARAALQDFLNHPEREVEVLGPLLGQGIEDHRTPEQIAAGERYVQELLSRDMEAVCQQLGR
jgi:hypothetical protein